MSTRQRPALAIESRRSARAKRYASALDMIGNGRSLNVAAELAGMTRSAMYKKSKSDPAFARDLDLALAGSPRRCPHCDGVVA